jgi:hypothetical protein
MARKALNFGTFVSLGGLPFPPFLVFSLLFDSKVAETAPIDTGNTTI